MDGKDELPLPWQYSIIFTTKLGSFTITARQQVAVVAIYLSLFYVRPVTIEVLDKTL